MEELKEKDKLLIVNDKKNLDYEIMINQIQEQATKELTEKQRFDMLKKQDLEIHTDKPSNRTDILENFRNSSYFN